jgi:predicted DNA-binding antitoxin AbrB/MazE fold protein
MITTVEAVYQGGVFKPIRPVDLPENQRVQVQVNPVRAEDVGTWLAAVELWQRDFVARRGYLPDSTYFIAEDRMRDV